MTINILLEALSASWSRDTAYRTDQKDWTPDKKETGQCTITAMLVYDYFGGKIKRGTSKKYNILHYWNEIDGEKIDLTFNQFLGRKDDIVFTDIITKPKEALMRIANVRNRYEILKKRVEIYLDSNLKI
jgi:hypothetical protein